MTIVANTGLAIALSARYYTARVDLDERDANGAWAPAHRQLACAVSDQGGGSAHDPYDQGTGTQHTYRLETKPGAGLAIGQRATVWLANGREIGPLIVLQVVASSLSAGDVATAAKDENASAGVPVWFRRFDRNIGQWTMDGPYDAAVAWGSGSPPGENVGVTHRDGTLWIDEAARVAVGDVVVGLPGATSATVLEVRPAIVGRREVMIRSLLPSGA